MHVTTFAAIAFLAASCAVGTIIYFGPTFLTPEPGTLAMWVVVAAAGAMQWRRHHRPERGSA
jgi:hypothetical protein